jgi:acyl-CoA synthetase (NDP forming)
MGSHGIPEGLQSLHEGHIPSFAFPEPAAIALARASRYGRWLETPEGNVPNLGTIRSEDAERAIDLATQRAKDRRAWLTPGECRALLEAYGIGMAEPRFAGSAVAAADATARIGAPVAIKLASRTISHKTEMGGVVLDVRTPDEAERAYEHIAQRLRTMGREAEMDGVIVQPMVQDGVEVIIGMTQVSSFGPVVMFGLGGVGAELLNDVAFRIHPLTDRDAHELVRSVRGFRLLEGWRGAPPGDIAAVEQTLLRVSRLVADRPEIVEMDLNPIKVMPPGHGCVVVDARISVRKR